MQTYRRFVSYVYQYENGKKAGNRGFIKVEARGNTCSIQIALKGICNDGNGHCKVYGFKREDGLLKGSLLAECPVKTGMVQEQLAFLRSEMGRAGYGLSELSGVIFQGDDDNMYGTQWDDEPMKMENFQPDPVNDRQPDPEEAFAQKEQNEETEEILQKEEPAAEEAVQEREKEAEQPVIEEIAQLQPQENHIEIREEQTESYIEDTAPQEKQAQEEKPQAAVAVLNEEEKEETKELAAAERPEAENGPEALSKPADLQELKQTEILEEPKEEPRSEETAEAAVQDLSETSAEAMQQENHPEMQVLTEQQGNQISPKAQAPAGANPKPQGERQLSPEPATVIIAKPKGEEVIPGMYREQAQTPKGQRYAETPAESSTGWQAQNRMPVSAEAQGKKPIPVSAEPRIENQMPSFTDSQIENRMPVSAQPQIESQMPVPAQPQAESQMPAFAEPQIENRMPAFADFPRESGKTATEKTATNPPEYDEEPLGTLDTTIPISELKRKKNPSDYIKPEIEAANVPEQTGSQQTDFYPFTDGVLQNCRKISLEDLCYLDPRDQGMRNNRFVQHGYQMFGHLLLAKVARNSQYILGVPGMYQQQEKFMADMFGFHNFKCARRSGSRPACFGYWYRLIYPPKLGSGNGNSD